MSSQAMDATLAYPWPGNVRELRNRLERAVAMARTDHIMPPDLFPEQVSAARDDSGAPRPFATLSEAREDPERRQIEIALQETKGYLAEAARLLGVSRTTLWEKMRRLGLAVEER
jgi:DNA-binding NtrC family response regulator